MDNLTLVQDGTRTLVLNPRARRLGSLFLPVRRLYFLNLPLLLGFTGLICLAFLSDWAMLVGAAVASCVAIFLVFDLLTRDAPLRLSTVLAFTLGLGYGLGTLNTWLTLPRYGETLAAFLGMDVANLSQAMGGLLLAMALLLSVGEIYELPIFGEEFRLSFTMRTLTVLSIGSIFRVATIFTGQSGGFDVEATNGHPGIVQTISHDLQNPLFALTLCAAVNAKGGVQKIYLWSLTVILFCCAIPLGRREMIYSILLGLLALRFGDFRVKLSLLKKVMLAVLVTGLLYGSTLLFFYFRISGYSLAHGASVSQRVDAVLELIETQKYSEVREKFSSNVEQRTFILGFLSELVGYTNTMPGGHGRDVLQFAELVLPSAISPNKDLSYTEEGFANELFGSNYEDEANSVLTTGTVDFGFPGLLLYPLCFMAMLRIFLEISGELLPPFAAALPVFFCLCVIIEPETDMISYFLVMRDGLLLGLIVTCFLKLPGLKFRSAR